MDRQGVMQWVADYERAWRSGDVAAVEDLFTPEAHYRPSPYEPDAVGHKAIKSPVALEPVAVDGQAAVVRVEVRYGDPLRQEYRDLWLLRFASDGRVADFEEWAYWPGKPYSAEQGD